LANALAQTAPGGTTILPPAGSTGSLVAAANGNPQLQQTAAYVGALCPNLAVGTDLRTRCSAALGASVQQPALANAALEAITPQEILAQKAVVDGTLSPATSAVANRIATIGRLGFGGPIAQAYRPIQVATNGDTAGLGGATAPALQGFFNIVVGTGDKDTNTLETGYDFDQSSLTGGVDYRFNDKLTAGVSLSYGRTDLDFNSKAGTMKSKTVVGTVYGLWTVNDRIEISGLASYGRVDYRSDRTIQYAESATSTISRNAHGKTHGDQWEATLTAAYAMPASDGWAYGPSVSISGRWLDVNAFAETGANGLDLDYNKQSDESLQLAGGFDVSKAISTKSGIISPYARVRAIYETKDDSRNVIVHYVADTTGAFSGIRLTSSPPDRFRWQVGGGVAAQLTGGWALFADAETLLGMKDVNAYNFTFGVRKEF
jgi:uncharacterized protein YhjY with autotransporter beta-barrel domain